MTYTAEMRNPSCYSWAGEKYAKRKREAGPYILNP